MHLIRVAEHLGASSRRPRHPFPAQMAGEPWPCTCGHGPKKPSRHTMKSNCGDLRSFLHVWTRDLDGHVTVQIHLPLLTATLVLQREPGKVVQGVAPDWICSFRIKCVGLEPIFGPHQWWTAEAAS